LLQPVNVWMVPERACIGRRELIDKTLTGLDRFLAETWNAVHGDRQPDAVPMYRCRFFELVFDDDTDGLALPHADLRPGNAAVVAPDVRLGARLTDKRPPAGYSGECEILRRSGANSNSRERGSGCHADRTGDKRAATERRLNNVRHRPSSYAVTLARRRVWHRARG